MPPKSGYKMILGTLENVIEAISLKFMDQLFRRIGFTAKEKYSLLKETNNPVIETALVEAALASRINDNERIEKILSIYREYSAATASNWSQDPEQSRFIIKSQEFAYRRIGMIYIASHDIENAMISLKKSYLEARNLNMETATHEFLMANLEKIAQGFKEAAESYQPVTETIKRDAHLLSMYNVILEDYDTRTQTIEALH